MDVSQISTFSNPTESMLKALARFYPKPTKWPEIVKLFDQKNLFISDLMKILNIEMNSIPYIRAYWDGLGFCQVTLRGLAMLYEAIDCGLIEIETYDISFDDSEEEKTGHGPDKHRILIRKVVDYLKQLGISSEDIEVESTGFGGRADIVVENRGLYVECGNSRPEKTLKTLSNGGYQLLVPYPNEDMVSVSYYFKPVKDFKVQINPYGYIVPFDPTSITADENVFLTDEEYDALLNTINTNCRTGLRNYCMLLLFGTTALRVSEVINLREEDIDFSNKKLVIRPDGAYRRDRTIIVPDVIMESLDKWNRKRPPSDNFFSTIKGQPIAPRYVLQLLERKAAEANIQKKVNSLLLRQRAIISMIKNGDTTEEIITKTHVNPHIFNRIQTTVNILDL